MLTAENGRLTPKFNGALFNDHWNDLLCGVLFWTLTTALSFWIARCVSGISI
jgi:hypothetical protein